MQKSLKMIHQLSPCTFFNHVFFFFLLMIMCCLVTKETPHHSHFKLTAVGFSLLPLILQHIEPALVLRCKLFAPCGLDTSCDLTVWCVHPPPPGHSHFFRKQLTEQQRRGMLKFETLETTDLLMIGPSTCAETCPILFLVWIWLVYSRGFYVTFSAVTC